MDAVEYIKTIHRLCESQNGYSGCSGCPLLNEDDYCSIVDARERAEDVVQIVEQWAKGHPVKTRKSEFQKMFPNANMYSITTTFCTAHFDKKKACEVSVPSEEMCEKCRYKYWNEEVDE